MLRCVFGQLPTYVAYLVFAPVTGNLETDIRSEELALGQVAGDS